MPGGEGKAWCVVSLLIAPVNGDPCMLGISDSDFRVPVQKCAGSDFTHSLAGGKHSRTEHSSTLLECAICSEILLG